jgi:hypothetical protein
VYAPGFIAHRFFKAIAHLAAVLFEVRKFKTAVAQENPIKATSEYSTGSKPVASGHG